MGVTLEAPFLEQGLHFGLEEIDPLNKGKDEKADGEDASHHIFLRLPAATS
jgi:hypothetical protein